MVNVGLGTYLDISLYLVHIESLTCNCEIRMHVVVMHLEMIVVDCRKFLEEEGKFDACCAPMVSVNNSI